MCFRNFFLIQFLIFLYFYWLHLWEISKQCSITQIISTIWIFCCDTEKLKKIVSKKFPIEWFDGWIDWELCVVMYVNFDVSLLIGFEICTCVFTFVRQILDKEKSECDKKFQKYIHFFCQTSSKKFSKFLKHSLNFKKLIIASFILQNASDKVY